MAACEINAESLDAALVAVPKNLLIGMARHKLELFSPFAASVNVFPRHVLVEGNIHHIHSFPAGRGGSYDIIQRLRPCKADAPGFFNHLDGRFVRQPFFLVGQKHVPKIYVRQAHKIPLIRAQYALDNPGVFRRKRVGTVGVRLFGQRGFKLAHKFKAALDVGDGLGCYLVRVGQGKAKLALHRVPQGGDRFGLCADLAPDYWLGIRNLAGCGQFHALEREGFEA